MKMRRRGLIILVVAPLLTALSLLHVTPPPPPPDCKPEMLECGTALREGYRGWPAPIIFFYDNSLETPFDPEGLVIDLLLAAAATGGLLAVASALSTKRRPGA